MMNSVIKAALNSKGLPRLSESGTQKYTSVLNKLGIPLDSSIADFYLSYDESGFIGRSYQMYHICWAYLNTFDYEILLKNLWEKRPWGLLPKNYIPLSSFEGEKIFLYNIENNSVGLVSEIEINDIIAKKFMFQWNSFDEFLIWFFQII